MTNVFIFNGANFNPSNTGINKSEKDGLGQGNSGGKWEENRNISDAKLPSPFVRCGGRGEKNEGFEEIRNKADIFESQVIRWGWGPKKMLFFRKVLSDK
jgi:hypothetical protein